MSENENTINVTSIPDEELIIHYNTRIEENNNKIAAEQLRITSLQESIASFEQSIIDYQTMIAESESKIADYTFDSEADTETAQRAGLITSAN